MVERSGMEYFDSGMECYESGMECFESGMECFDSGMECYESQTSPIFYNRLIRSQNLLQI